MSSRIIIGLLSVMAAVAGAGTPGPGSAVPTSATSPAEAAVELEYRALLEKDDAAQEAVEKLVKNEALFEEKGAAFADATIRLRIREQLDPVRKSYEAFIGKHPRHASARLAFGSFLNDLGEVDEAVVQMEKSRELDPSNPAAWNNLANHYGHTGEMKKAFEYYAKAIGLNPKESVYHQNLATSVFLFRTDAKEFYGIDEQKVFDKALGLYREALRLEPEDFALAQDVAQTYYGIQPPRVGEAIEAWNGALKLAADDVQREGVYIHLARVNISAGKFEEARRHLEKVQLEAYKELKARLEKSLASKEKAKAAE